MLWWAVWTRFTEGGGDCRGKCTIQRRVRDPSGLLWSMRRKKWEEKKIFWKCGSGQLSMTSDVFWSLQLTHNLTNTHTNIYTHTLSAPQPRGVFFFFFITLPVSRRGPHNPSVSHNRKLKECGAAPRAPPLFDLCEPLSLMKISAALRTTGAPASSLIEERLVHRTTAEHLSQQVSAVIEMVRGVREGRGVRLERPGDAVSVRFPSDGCRLHTNSQIEIQTAALIKTSTLWGLLVNRLQMLLRLKINSLLASNSATKIYFCVVLCVSMLCICSLYSIIQMCLLYFLLEIWHL